MLHIAVHVIPAHIGHAMLGKQRWINDERVPRKAELAAHRARCPQGARVAWRGLSQHMMHVHSC